MILFDLLAIAVPVFRFFHIIFFLENRVRDVYLRVLEVPKRRFLLQRENFRFRSHGIVVHIGTSKY